MTLLALAVCVCANSNAECSWFSFTEGINAKKIILHDDTLWLNTLNGVYSMNLLDDSIVMENKYECADIHVDHEGRVYCVSAYGEVSRYVGGFKEYTGGMTDNYTLNIGITVTDDGVMWLLHHVDGLFRFTDRGWKREIAFKGSPGWDIDSYRGELWIASCSGVFAYKDSSWVRYTVDDGLPVESTMFCAISPSGTVWVSTEDNSVARFNGSAWSVIPGNEIIETYGILSLAADSDDTLWVGTNGGGIVRYTGSLWESYSIRDGLGSNVVLSVSISPEGKLAAATHDGSISLYDAGNWHTIMPGNGFASDNITTLYLDYDGGLYVGTKKGLSMYDWGGICITFTERTGLAGREVTSIAHGAHGDLWVGSNGGFARCHDGVWTTWRSNTQRLGMCIAGDIITDTRGDTWIENRYRKILYKFDGVSVSEITSVSSVRDIETDENGHVWFATFGNGIAMWDGASWHYYTEDDGLSCDYVNDLAVDPAGTIWCATDCGGVSVYDGENWTRYSVSDGLPSECVRTVSVNDNGTAWITTDTDGIAVFEGRTWTAYAADNGLPSDEVTGVAYGNDGMVWVGTRKNGIGVYDGAEWATHTIEDGLSDNGIRVIVADSKGTVFAGSYSEGLSIFVRDVAVEDVERTMPRTIVINAAYPNPFNSHVTIDYDVFGDSLVELKVYNIHGQLVDILRNSLHSPGHYAAVWNAGTRASGVYFCVLRAGNAVSSAKVMYVK